MTHVCKKLHLVQKTEFVLLSQCYRCSSNAASALIHTMQKLLYDDNSIGQLLLLRDLDMADCKTHVDSELLKNIATKRNQRRFITQYNQILVTCDKLAMHDTINDMFNTIRVRSIRPKIKHTSLIINHALSNDELLDLYAHTDAYEVLYGHPYYSTSVDNGSLTPSRCKLRDASLNGLRIAGMSIRDNIISNDDVRYFTSLTKLGIYNDTSQISTCDPFARSLKILIAGWQICDAGLSQCTAIEYLNACNNPYITTCAPFAKSLKVLNAFGSCGINDKGLELCTSIAELNAASNDKITTCDSFAKSLKILNMSEYSLMYRIPFYGGPISCTVILDANDVCDISKCAPPMQSCGLYDIGYARVRMLNDDNIKLCTGITKLIAWDNPNITTCAQFAKTLTILDASYGCGIGDAGLAMCHFIEQLNATDNPKITTCVPFSKSLLILNADGDRCGITTAGILSCKLLCHLCSNRNSKIDRDKIMMGTDNRRRK